MAGETVLAVWTDFFTQSTFVGNELWRWLALLGVLLASLVAGKIISSLLQRYAERVAAREGSPLVVMLLKTAAAPVSFLTLAGGLYLAGAFMNLTYEVKWSEAGKEVSKRVDFEGHWRNVCKTIAVLAAGWFIYRLVDVVELLLTRWTSKTETLLDDQLVPLVRKSLRVFVVIVATLFIAQNIFDWRIASLLAGLGLGGLAFALAAKDTVANLFGSVTIFSDRPFHMGDRVVIQGHEGYVESVGFRSTRIRTLKGHMVTIPNAIVANETVENVSARPCIKRVLNVTVTYDTSPEKLQRGVEILREMVEARKEHFVPEREPQVFFSDFNADSLNIVVYYWFTPPEWWEYVAFNHDFNMELLDRFNNEGIEFAFPTQTLYLKQDSPIAADLRIGRPDQSGKQGGPGQGPQ